MKGILTLVAVLGVAVTAAKAQSVHAPRAAGKMSVDVNCTAENDTTGMMLCSALRDAVAASPRFEVYQPSRTDPAIRIHVISMALTDFGISAQSVTTTFTGDQVYLGHSVYAEGPGSVKAQAERILAGVDQEIVDYGNGKAPGN